MEKFEKTLIKAFKYYKFYVKTRCCGCKIYGNCLELSKEELLEFYFTEILTKLKMNFIPFDWEKKLHDKLLKLIYQHD